MTTKAAAEAELLAAAPALLRELEAAHQILGLAFNLLTDPQRAELKRLVDLRELTGDGSSTRMWERRDLLSKVRLLVRAAVPETVIEPDDGIPF